MKGPPNGWFDYEAVGRLIPYTRIIAFKTPLKKELHHARSDEPKLDRFTPQDCVRAVRDITGGKKLGLVLNLTFTTKYYDPHDFERQGIHYGAIKCPGHEIPNDELFDTFQRSLYNYFWDYPDRNRVVGIHCTHGVNRTGYMIARFLIQCEGWDVEEAITTVGDARGSPLERENYIAHLHNLHMPSYKFPKIPTAKDVSETEKRKLQSESETEKRKLQSKSETATKQRKKQDVNFSASDGGNEQVAAVPGVDDDGETSNFLALTSDHEAVDKTDEPDISSESNNIQSSVIVDCPETESKPELLTENENDGLIETETNSSIKSNGGVHIQLSEDAQEFIPLFNTSNKRSKRHRLS